MSVNQGVVEFTSGARSAMKREDVQGVRRCR